MSIQVVQFPDGGFVIHKIPAVTGKGRYSAWYDAKARPVDAECIDALNRSRPVSRTGEAWSRIEQYGRIYRPNVATETH